MTFPLPLPSSKKFSNCFPKALLRTIRWAGCSLLRAVRMPPSPIFELPSGKNRISCKHLQTYRTPISKGDVRGAVRAARSAAQFAPNDAEVQRTLGHSYSAAGDLNAAVMALRRAVELDSTRPELHDDLGTVLLHKADPQNAAVEFFEALRLQPDFAPAHFHLGVLRYQQKSMEEAEQHLRMAVELNPDNADAHYYFAQVLRNKGENDAAIRELQACIELKLNYAEARNDLGLLLQNTGEMEQAIEEFRQAVKWQPENRTFTIIWGWPICRAGMGAEPLLNFKPPFACVLTMGIIAEILERPICKLQILTLQYPNSERP